MFYGSQGPKLFLCPHLPLDEIYPTKYFDKQETVFHMFSSK